MIRALVCTTQGTVAFYQVLFPRSYLLIFLKVIEKLITLEDSHKPNVLMPMHEMVITQD